MINPPISPSQVAEKSVLDFFNRQAYLGNSFTYSTNATAIGSTFETASLLIANPASNTKSLFVIGKRLVSLTTGQSVIYNLYYNPVITNPGTAQTPVNVRTGSNNLATGKISVNPLVSSFGNFLGSVVSTGLNQVFSNLLQIIDPGYSMLITVVVSTAPTTISSQILWYEI